jgi:hypothetical protein
MAQIARNLTDTENGLLNGKRYLIHDRDPLYTRELRIPGEGERESGVKVNAIPG